MELNNIVYGQNGIQSPDEADASTPAVDKNHPYQSGPSGNLPRISKPVELMRDSYDVVVIGSGYGGGVAASRMARGKQRVCVLERGKERWPGEFPEYIDDALSEIRVSGEFAPGDRRSVPGKVVSGGNPTGLYHVAVGDGQNVYMGNGLGGTSLLNANVFLESDPKVLDMSIWPEELRGRESWRKYYDRAKEVLEPTEYPLTYPKLLKAEFLKKQAELMSWDDKFYRVPQTTKFEDGPNSTGVFMRASTLTGMDATGINDGSKTTTLVTYLADAWNWGAELFCECEVRYVTKAPGREGYIVYFAWHSGNRERFPIFYDDLMWVHAKKFVFFGAGSIGTTEILLRSMQMGLDMSKNVGTQMSGNGDMLGFGYNTDFDINCMGRPDPIPDRPVGPCITSVVDLRDQENPLEGFVIEDCSVPLALTPFMFDLMEHLPGEATPIYTALRLPLKTLSRLAGKYLGPYFSKGSIAKTAVYLIMSHDSSQGSLSLRDDQPVLSYSGVGRSKSVSRIQKFLEQMTAAVNGNFVANPAWTLLGKQEITVHPIGGASISNDGTGNNGVTNDIGQIFKGSGEETYDGLIVCDGAILPAALGVNPFATITALAERSLELLSLKNNIDIDYGTQNGVLDLFGSPKYSIPNDAKLDEVETVIKRTREVQNASIGFSEVMSGFIYTGRDVKSFEIAAKLAQGRCEAARFFLSVKAWNTEELINSPFHGANLTGTFSSSALGGIFMVLRGTFQLFNEDPRQPNTTNLTYDFDMVSPSGRKLHLNGYKVVNTKGFFNPLELLKQTTTLYVVITETGENSAKAEPVDKVVARGMLHILPADLAHELQTFQTTGPDLLRRFGSLGSFLTYFAGKLAVPFLSPLGMLQWPGISIDRTSSVTTPTQTIQLEASDKVQVTMLMWNPTKVEVTARTGPPPIILFVPGAATDHTMYALPTIKRNAIDYFREAGYQTYCVTHRVGRTVVSRQKYTAYDARLDIHAALVRIRKIGAAQAGGDETPPVYVVAHCAGSLALCCGLLDGTIPASWIRGATCSMVAMHPKFGKVDALISGFPVSLYEKLVSSYFNCASQSEDSMFQKFLNQALRLYPAGKPEETCRSVVCHRSELVFGRLWTHANLNEATHSQLERFLGGTSMTSLAWLMHAGTIGYVTTDAPVSQNLVTLENLRRLKGLPILFLSGAENMVFTAENTDTTYTTLCNVHGKELYERQVFPGRGHLDCWMGESAHEDVYPRVRRHADKYMRKRSSESP